MSREKDTSGSSMEAGDRYGTAGKKLPEPFLGNGSGNRGR